MGTSRRKFLQNVMHAAGIVVLPLPLGALTLNESISFGIIADLHHDLIPDGIERLNDFLGEAKKRENDFLIQMGDFCFPLDSNSSFVKTFNDFPSDTFHVLGNHDMDLGFKRKETVAFWGMPDMYYSFDRKGIHFVVLDGNDPNPPPFEGYARYIGPKQLEWLENDLKNTELPTILFSHQSLENMDGGIANNGQVRTMLEDINKDKENKILACFSGHHHTDYHENINGIYYIQINSASYRWVGSKYKSRRFSDATHEKYRWLDHMIPYKDALYTFVKIDTEGNIMIESKNTEFMEPGPKELGMPEQPENNKIVPFISAMNLPSK